MNKQRTLVLGIGLVLSIFSGCASASKSPDVSAQMYPGQSGAKIDLASWEKRPHSTISQSEFTDHVCDLFASIEKNQEGYLTASETSKLPSWLRGVQPDSHGQITIVDLVREAQSKFKTYAKTSPDAMTYVEWQSLEASK